MTPQQAALAKRRAQQNESKRRLRAAHTADQAVADQAADTASKAAGQATVCLAAGH